MRPRARRGRASLLAGLSRGGPNGRGRGRGVIHRLADDYSSSPGTSSPQNGRETYTFSEVKLVQDGLPELSNELIDFVSQSPATSEPPRKRQKMRLERNMAGAQGMAREQEPADTDPEFKFIIVNKATWDIKLAGSKLSDRKTPVERSNVRLYISWDPTFGPQYIEIVDDARQSMFYAPLPRETNGFEDVLLALEVDKESKKWAKGQGRLWTEFGLSLFYKDGSDFLQINFTIKWNITTSPYDIAQVSYKPKALSKVMSRYFPNSNVSVTEKWTPQDFYQSVHAPDKNDDSASMTVDGLKTDLYPFQKRAVQWLLRKEGVEWSAVDHRVKESPISKNQALPMSFIHAVDYQGQTCYISHLFGLATLDVAPFGSLERNLKGGILAEEMGLGKTVEIISLISLHKRPQEISPVVFDPFTGANVRPTAATLIITPPSILQQWISEINRHAPHLKVMHYEGIKAHSSMNSAEILENLATSDVVISTYSTLAAEIHFTHLNPEKKLRRESKYPRPKSPLMQLSWYRVCIDEAQMIESGVSNAAVVARMIPRIHPWCISGTPVRKNVNDLLGLLIFLRYEPYASTKHIWSSLISSHKYEFGKLFGKLALRHSKQSVREELKLPSQRRYVITMPFTPIEEQHYQELFIQMCKESGLDTQGAPLTDEWDPDAVSGVMRRWLVRLRQTALHPEVGGRNRRALGHKDGPLRTVDQVLDAMVEQTDVSIRNDQRSLLTSKLKRGQLFENSPRVQEALDIWVNAVSEASVAVNECREQLQQEIDKAQVDGKFLNKESSHVSGGDSDNSDEVGEIDPTSRLGLFRNRLRAALEIEHMAVFFRANAYFQIKSNENLMKPNSPEFESLEKLETNGYEEAKKLRREILQEIYRKSDKLMKTISKRAASQSFVEIPEFPTNFPKAGLVSRRIVEQLGALATSLDIQANQLDELREQTIQFLIRPLVDEDEGIEITGDEYEESKQTQNEVMVYIQALRAMIADRHDALTGQENLLIEHDIEIAVRFAKNGKGVFPEKTLQLINNRNLFKPTKDMGSVRGAVAELRALVTSLRPESENGSARAQAELAIVAKQLGATQLHLKEQTKATTGLEKEIELFTIVMNTRLEYYRQLQQISDMVVSYEGPNNDRVIKKMLDGEEKLSRKIATAKSKHRYLVHLKMEALNPQEQRICVICRESFEVGALTVCGHQYCKECIQLWWKSHRNCPICKRKLIQADLHDITYKPQELSIEAEEVHETTQQRSSPSSASPKSAIYSEISKSKLAEIKNIELDGPCFTTKVDTLARHLIWLRETDRGAKSIIYSQFKDFLDVLALAFQRFRIGFSSIDKPNGTEKFKQDPRVECFLLHSRAHSSGLNLVNASHVFLCEPLLNTALELQAIARVDRIGQHQETNVWLYLVDGTVEESIHQLSVKRRMEHIGQNLVLKDKKGKSRELTPEELLDTKLEEANSMEMQQASLNGLLAKGGKGGEMVGNDDLWDCLFGGIGLKQRAMNKVIGSSDVRFNEELGRQLRAEAAEERQVAVQKG